MPGSTQDLTLYGGAATGSMTRYDERHENLIRPDFQYIIRVTKKSQVPTSVKTKKNTPPPPLLPKKKKRRSGSLRRPTIRHVRHSFSYAPVESRPRPNPPGSNGQGSGRFTLQKHGCPWPQTGSWTHGKNGYVDPLMTRKRTCCHGPNNLRTRIGSQTMERKALQADKRDNFPLFASAAACWPMYHCTIHKC